MVSVIAVNIQLSSPSGVRRSFNLPGTLQRGRWWVTGERFLSIFMHHTHLSMISGVTPLTRLSFPTRWRQYQSRAVLMGVVRQVVKRSAGNVGFIGSISLAPQAANWMQLSSWPTRAGWINATLCKRGQLKLDKEKRRCPHFSQCFTVSLASKCVERLQNKTWIERGERWCTR